MAFGWLKDLAGNVASKFGLGADPSRPSQVAPTPDANAYNQWGYDVANRYEGLGQEADRRAAPQATNTQIDYGQANPYLQRSGGAYGTGLQSLGGTEALGGMNQIQLMDQLKAQAYGTAGPSVAEIRMRQAADEAQRRNLSIAAGGAGPSRASAQLAAINANAQQQGGLVRDLGAQRAAEQIQARGELGQVAGAFRQQGQSGAGTYGQLGSGYGQLGGQFADMAQGQAGLNQQTTLANLNAGMQQRGLNDQMGQFYFGLGDQARQQQNNANMQLDTNRGNWQIGQAGVNANTYGTGMQSNTQRFGSALGFGAGAAMLLSDMRAKMPADYGTDLSNPYTPMQTPGLSQQQQGALALMQSGAAQSGSSGAAGFLSALPMLSKMTSDMRAKTPAGGGQSFERVRDFPDAPNYAYQYKDPAAPGARPGVQVGPMAQDLESTPAGATAVGTDPATGRKFIDPARLALLTAGEVSQQNQDLEQLKRAVFGRRKVA